jgi:hypothetical protein
VLLCHGSPDDRLRALADLDGIDFQPGVNSEYQAHVLDSFLNSYGQSAEVTGRLLRQLSSPALPLRLVVHGHDRDESGFFVEGGNQVCPVLFGALPENKRYLVLDLAATYARPEALRDGVEVRRVHQ